MRTLWSGLVLMALLLSPGMAGRADEIIPEELLKPKAAPAPKETPIKLAIEVREDLKESRLQIPRNLLAAMKVPAAGEKKGASLPIRTMMAGLAMAFALAFGGLWLVRRGLPMRAGTTGLWVASGVAVLCATCWGSSALADKAVSPPTTKPAPSNTAKPAILPNAAGTSELLIEVVENGDTVKLLVRRDALAEYLSKTAPASKAEAKR